MSVAGTEAAVYTRDAAFPVATFHGPAHWEVLAVARLTPAGAAESVEQRRAFESDDGRIDVRLRDLMPFLAPVRVKTTP